MKCHNCKSSNLKIVDSRHTDESVRRRRVCVECEFVWTTYEIALTKNELDRVKWSRWEPEEIELLKVLIAKGRTHREIASILGRPKRTVDQKTIELTKVGVLHV